MLVRAVCLLCVLCGWGGVCCKAFCKTTKPTTQKPTTKTTNQKHKGDRTKEALTSFAESLVPSAGQPHVRHGQLRKAPKTPGCNLAGACCVFRA